MAVIRGEQDSWVDGSRSFVFAGHLRCIRHLEDALEALSITLTALLRYKTGYYFGSNSKRSTDGGTIIKKTALSRPGS